MRWPLKFAVATGIALTFAASAEAGFWIEAGDAGDLFGTSQITMGIGSLDSIAGTIIDGVDRDMFLIRITGVAPFSVTTVGGATFDTQLFLFDEFGIGVLANDDTDAVTIQSTIPASATGALLPGLYNLAISKRSAVAGSSDPVSAGGFIFPDMPRDAVVGPTGPGGALPITGWFDGDPGDPSYTFTLTGAGFAVVPEPNTLISLGVGAIMLMGYGSRRRRIAA